MNMFLVYSALGLDPQQTQAVLFDKHPDGPYLDLVAKAFSPRHPVVRHGHYGRKRVLFRRLVFHLESPAGLIFPKVRGSARKPFYSWIAVAPTKQTNSIV